MLAAAKEDLLRSPREYVVGGSGDAELVANIKFGACLEVRNIAISDVRPVQKPRVRNRVAKTEIEKRCKKIKFAEGVEGAPSSSSAAMGTPTFLLPSGWKYTWHRANKILNQLSH